MFHAHLSLDHGKSYVFVPITALNLPVARVRSIPRLANVEISKHAVYEISKLRKRMLRISVFFTRIFPAPERDSLFSHILLADSVRYIDWI